MNLAVSNVMLYFFNVKITTDDDPYFLYVLDVGETDFHNLKREQSLLVDFNVFPIKLIELLGACEESSVEYKNNISISIHRPNELGSQSPPTFVTRLDPSTGQLAIVEVNMFKQLTHISLSMRPGNDAAIKSYLASRLGYTLSIHKKLVIDHQSKCSQLEQELITIHELNRELETLRLARARDQETLQANHTQELSQLRLQALQNQENLRETHESQLSSLREDHSKQMELARQRGDDLERFLHSLQEEKSNNEQKIREFTRLQAIGEAEIKRMSEELRRETASREELSHQKRELQLRLEDRETKLLSSERQLTVKDEALSRLTAQHKDLEESQAATRTRVDQLTSACAGLQEQLRGAASEIARGNQAMQLLQEQNKRLKEKIQLKSDVIKKQEALVIELRQKISELDIRLNASENGLSTANQREEMMKNELDLTKNRLKEAENLIQNNEKVITWLNQEISKLQLADSRYGLQAASTAGLNYLDFSNNGHMDILSTPNIPTRVQKYTDVNKEQMYDLVGKISQHPVTPKEVPGNNSSASRTQTSNPSTQKNRQTSPNYDTKGLNVPTTPFTQESRGSRSRSKGNSPAIVSPNIHRYDWQREDFGLENEDNAYFTSR